MTTKTYANAYTIQLATTHTPVPGTKQGEHVGLEIIQETIEELAEAFEGHVEGRQPLAHALGGTSMKRYSRVLREVASALETAEQN